MGDTTGRVAAAVVPDIPTPDRRAAMDGTPVSEVAASAGRSDTLHDLGSLGRIRVQVAVDPSPWELPIDTLVVSVGPSGVGQLGAAVRRALPDAAWDAHDPSGVTPDEPRLLVLPAADARPNGPALRRVVLASVRQAERSPRLAEPPATLEAVRRATVSAVTLALSQDTRALGLPLLGAGAIGFPNSEVAFEVVPAVRATLLEHQSTPQQAGRPFRLVFVCRDRAASRAIERVWGYAQMLCDAQAEALRDDVLLAEAAQAQVSKEELARAFDVPEDVLWQPCLSELTRLRHLDTELDDLRLSLVGSLEREHLLLEREPPAPGTGAKGWRREAAGQRHVEALANVEQGIEDMLHGDARWRELTGAREGALVELRAALLQESLLPRLRLAINNRLGAQRRANLEARRAEFRRPLKRAVTLGLRGRPRPGALVHTAAHDELAGLLDPSRSPRASVGVAGPRGCGKSTLLQEVTESWTRGLSILVPAPATYASREFLLHLYSLVCHGVLATDRETRVRLRDERVPPARLRTASLLHLVVVPVLALIVGIAALAASRVWADGSSAALRSAGGAVLVAAAVPYLLLLLAPVRLRGQAVVEQPDSPPPGLLLRPRLRWRLPGALRVLLVAAAVGGVVVAASFGILTVRRTVGLGLLVAALGTGVFWFGRDHSMVTPSDGGSSPTGGSSKPPPATYAIPPTSGDAALTTHLRLSRRTVLLLAVAAGQLTVAVAAVVLLAVDPAAAPLDTPLVLGAALVAAGLAALLPGLRLHGALDSEFGARLAPPVDPYSFRARQDLDKIRYQRSVSSGWTSSVKLSGSSWLPFGVDAGVTGTTTEADVPLSVPEIVEGIKSLLPARGPAVLAIDELDKIESVDEARDFLNEIKGILEAQDTRFLVSMSEDAIARFERRGLPFRDVFDSAFDEVVRVPYLSASQAHALLNQRVTNVPEPFVALAFCLSGGLPRDLLRAADRLIAVAPATGGSAALPDVVREIVHADMAAKTEAVTAGMKSITVEPQVSQLIRSVQAVDACRPRHPRSRPCLLDEEWLAPLLPLGPVVGAAETGDLAERRELLRLGVELVGYLYYCRTLLELFCTETDWQVDRLIGLVDDDGRRLDELARARQNFAVNPFVAWEQLDTLRRSVGLVGSDLPAPFIVGGSLS